MFKESNSVNTTWYTLFYCYDLQWNKRFQTVSKIDSGTLLFVYLWTLKIIFVVPAKQSATFRSLCPSSIFLSVCHAWLLLAPHVLRRTLVDGCNNTHIDIIIRAPPLGERPIGIRFVCPSIHLSVRQHFGSDTITWVVFMVQLSYFIHRCRMVRGRYLYILRSKGQGHNWTLSTLWFWHNNWTSFQHTAFIFHT